MRLRAILQELRKGAGPPLLLLSAAGWIAFVLAGRWASLPVICDLDGAGAWPDGRRLGLFFALNPPAVLLLPWLLMLLAMMPPLLAGPLTHLWTRSLKRRRVRAVAAFLLAYATVWFAAGVVLLTVSIMLKSVLGAGWLPLSAAVMLATLWQTAPAKQTCLNRCHRLPRLSAFGFAADRDCLRYGFTFGLWCTGVCWALMLVPLAAKEGHVYFMAAATAVMLVERLIPPRPAQWRWPLSFSEPAFLRV